MQRHSRFSRNDNVKETVFLITIPMASNKIGFPLYIVFKDLIKKEAFFCFFSSILFCNGTTFIEFIDYSFNKRLYFFFRLCNILG